jgi:hypothetical protein
VPPVTSLACCGQRVLANPVDKNLTDLVGEL